MRTYHEYGVRPHLSLACRPGMIATHANELVLRIAAHVVGAATQGDTSLTWPADLRAFPHAYFRPARWGLFPMGPGCRSLYAGVNL